MPHTVKDRGEEYRKKLLSGAIGQPQSYYVGLYNESEDQLTDDADLPIPSEPDDGNYQRLQYPLGSDTMSEQINAEGDWQLTFEGQSFDLVNTTGGYVDAAFIVVPFAGEDDAETTDHLFFTVKLYDSQGNPTDVDLEGSNSFTFSSTFTDVDPA